MQLRYLKEIGLYKVTQTKQSNGSYISVYDLIGNYNTIPQEISDEASISIYGATVNKMYRLSSPKRTLENYLKPKINDESDNISKYFIKYNNAYYKISAVRENWIDIEYKESVTTQSV